MIHNPDSGGAALPYKKYVASILINPTPTVVVHENELVGVIVWTYRDVGIVQGTLLGAFPPDKTVLLHGGVSEDYPGNIVYIPGTNRIDADTIEASIGLFEAGLSPQPAGRDGFTIHLELRVYP